MSPVNTHIFEEKTSCLKRRQNGQGKYQNYNPGPQESRHQPFQGSAWKNSMGDDSGGKRGPGELGDSPGSPPLSSRTVHPDMQEVKQGDRRPAWMNNELLLKLKHRKEI